MSEKPPSPTEQAERNFNVGGRLEPTPEQIRSAEVALSSAIDTLYRMQPKLERAIAKNPSFLEEFFPKLKGYGEMVTVALGTATASLGFVGALIMDELSREDVGGGISIVTDQELADLSQSVATGGFGIGAAIIATAIISRIVKNLKD